jgi:hypothetical protein
MMIQRDRLSRRVRYSAHDERLPGTVGVLGRGVMSITIARG